MPYQKIKLKRTKMMESFDRFGIILFSTCSSFKTLTGLSFNFEDLATLPEKKSKGDLEAGTKVKLGKRFPLLVTRVMDVTPS